MTYADQERELIDLVSSLVRATQAMNVGDIMQLTRRILRHVRIMAKR